MECASGAPRVECERGERVECLSGDGVEFERGGTVECEKVDWGESRVREWSVRVGNVKGESGVIGERVECKRE